MKKRILKRSIVFGIAGAVALALTGCGNDGAQAEGGVQTIVIGIPNYFDKIAFLDENGDLAGYEVELLKRIDEKLADYEFEFQESNFENILISLDNGKIDLGSHELEYNEERAEKYLYGQEGYRDFTTNIMGLKGSGYTTFDSLAGKTLGSVNAGGNTAAVVNDYNAQHPDQEPIIQDFFGTISDDILVKSLEGGKWEAVESSRIRYEDYTKEFGDEFELGDVIATSEAYFLYPRDGEHEALRDAVDAAIKELKDSGELNEIAEKWTGYPAYFDD